MSKDAGVDRALLDLFARPKVLLDAVDAHCARIVERDEKVFRRNVGADADRARRQPYRFAVRGKRTTCRVDGKCGDVMVGPLGAVTRSAAAGRDIEIAPQCVRPRILHSRRQCNRLSFGQLRTGDIDVVVGQIGPDICIERDLAGGRLSRSSSRHDDAPGNERQECPAGEHALLPKID